MNQLKTTHEQRKAQVEYNTRQKERGYFQTRPWLPEEFREWHELLVRRAREWKEYDTDFVLPPLPPLKKPL